MRIFLSLHPLERTYRTHATIPLQDATLGEVPGLVGILENKIQNLVATPLGRSSVVFTV